ncbi:MULTISPECIES: dienelactone hydrolase [unclassified Undibacterium]|uniref:alpha/beta hydrolase family protein n=2 Tax=Bacteria TaxID=2 RepID=UPI002AC91591|nr:MULTISPECIES: dienelactone hydrolase [unclassified Undibacterium]MEB0140579.1 dienelactone hydrolase [Undibacterium sp. CCC2.1]MEB0173633.1 dienelactone hydrolase [Undibacterium sp. CCC1.1]MEB0177345.1 dienelactone hydrolase [Undibacterium sp. CCC3.4]MEB0216756.1 dienelactone hydrolase [Undibacterium sp. 5I2]WPX44564.1 dienelactone hydrolase [Undibacterium sp. CCC3.4]
MPSKFVRLFLVAGTLITPFCVAAQENRIDQIRPDAPALAAYGASRSGVTTLHLTHPGQLDILHTKAGAAPVLYDRPLTVEVWYPATVSASGSAAAGPTYRTVLRDGKTAVSLSGQAVRDASPDKAHGPYPLVIVSHGYPGNRFLLSHLTENLASKGYVVVAIDHTDSTYEDMQAFSSTLLNRSLDQLFVLEQMAALNKNDVGGRFAGVIDADQTALIGYSMGGYGVLNTIGGGLSATAVNSALVPNQALAIRAAGNASYVASLDPRIKAAVAFAPWGWNAGVWDRAGLAGIHTPVLFIAGSADDVSGYAPGVRDLFEGSVQAERYLLTFEQANHNAGAPMPAPKEAWSILPGQKKSVADHYMDAVWDSVRMNNISQHFVTAFLGKYLNKNAAMDAYLNLPEQASAGLWRVDANGQPSAEHTYWKGFPERTAVGLRLEKKAAQVLPQVLP